MERVSLLRESWRAERQRLNSRETLRNHGPDSGTSLTLARRTKPSPAKASGAASRGRPARGRGGRAHTGCQAWLRGRRPPRSSRQPVVTTRLSPVRKLSPRERWAPRPMSRSAWTQSGFGPGVFDPRTCALSDLGEPRCAVRATPRESRDRRPPSLPVTGARRPGLTAAAKNP